MSYNKHANNYLFSIEKNDFINIRDRLLFLTDLYNMVPYDKIVDDILYLFNLVNTKYYPIDYSLWYGLSGIKMITDNLPINLFDEKSKLFIEYTILIEARKKIKKYNYTHKFKELDMFSGVIGMIRALIEQPSSKYRNEINILIDDFSRIFLLYKNNLDKIFSVCADKEVQNTGNIKSFDYIDLSISHGATSCLMILYLSVINGFYSKSIVKAIDILYEFILKNIIDRTQRVRDIALVKLKKTFKTDSKKRKYTWCYGTLTVIYILSLVSEYFNLKENESIKQILFEEINNINDEYLNNNLFICHGLSGLILLLNILKNSYNQLVNEKMNLINSKKNSNLIRFENINRKNCILTGNLSILITKYIEKTNYQEALIYRMLLLK